MNREEAKLAGELVVIAEDFEDFLGGLAERPVSARYIRLTVETISNPTQDDGDEMLGSFIVSTDYFNSIIISDAERHLLNRLDAAGIERSKHASPR